MGFPPGRLGASELQLQSQLDRAWPTILKDGIEASAEAGVGKAVLERLRCASEKGARKGVRRRAKARVVEDVKKLSTELKVCALAKAELAANGDVFLPGSKGAHDVASQISLLAGSGAHEGGLVVRHATRILRSVKVERLARNHIGPAVELCTLNAPRTAD